MVAQTGIEVFLALGLRRSAVEGAELSDIVRSVDRGHTLCLDLHTLPGNFDLSQRTEEQASNLRMDNIVSQVKRVSQLIGEISQAAQQQTTGIAQVSDAVHQLDEVTQRNAALVEKSAAALAALVG